MLRQPREDKRDSPPVDLRLSNDEDRGKAVNAKAIRTRNSFERVGFAQTRAPVEIPSEQPGEISGRTCKVPEGFRCGILFDVDLPDSGRMIESMVGGVVRQISLIIGGTLYTVVFDPPLKRDDKFSGLKRWVRVPVRIDGDVLTVYWPDKTEVKGRVVQREKVEPELPQPA